AGPGDASISRGFLHGGEWASDRQLLPRVFVGGGQLGVPLAQRLQHVIEPKLEHQLRSERPHSPQNDRPDDNPDQPIGRGQVNLGAGGFGFGSAQDVIWDLWMVKPARKRTDYRDGPGAWQGRGFLLASSFALGGFPVLVQFLHLKILERP